MKQPRQFHQLKNDKVNRSLTLLFRVDFTFTLPKLKPSIHPPSPTFHQSFKLPRRNDQFMEIPTTEPTHGTNSTIYTFSKEESPEVTEELQVTGRTKCFLKNWHTLTNNQIVLNLVRGIRIDFMSSLRQKLIPNPIQFCDDELNCIDNEIQILLRKGAIIPVYPDTSQFLSNIFTRPKKSGGLRTIIN